MAKLNDSLLNFDSRVLDVNENTSQATNHTCSNNGERNEVEPTKTETVFSCDLTTCDILQPLNSPINHNKLVPETTPELSSTNLDAVDILQFHTIELDVNENPTNSTNQTCLNNSAQNEGEPSERVKFCSYDLTNIDMVHSIESPINKEITPDVSTTNLDILSESDNFLNTECNTSPALFNPLTACDSGTESSEIFNEVIANQLNVSDDCNKSLEAVDELETKQLNASLHKASENPTVNQSSDSGIQDWENNVAENTNADNFVNSNMCNNFGDMFTDFKNEEFDQLAKEEEFHDAVQFFKDPSSFNFLEHAGSSSAPADTLLTRSSLYVNFDPLHAKFYAESAKSNELHEIAEDDSEIFSAVPSSGPQNGCVQDIINKPEGLPYCPETGDVPNILNKPNMLPNGIPIDSVPEIVNKHLNNVSPRQSLGNILISFDSPVTSKDVPSQCLKTETPSKPQKLYTEEEFQQALKIQELTVQETFLKNQHDLEIARSQQQQEMENKIQEQERLCNVLHGILREFVDIVLNVSEENKMLYGKLEIAEKENDKLKEDLKTSVEDLQSVETTFADFHKRYEQCKDMLKIYNQNEGNFKQQIENMRLQLHEKEEMYRALQSRTQEMLDKANQELTNAKKAGDAQVAVLKAQLKKAEMKISSLENDVKHVKIENSKLSSICDDLMAKVSEA